MDQKTRNERYGAAETRDRRQRLARKTLVIREMKSLVGTDMLAPTLEPNQPDYYMLMEGMDDGA